MVEDWVSLSYDLMEESYDTLNGYGDELGACLTKTSSLPDYICTDFWVPAAADTTQITRAATSILA